ncbi:bifunctional dethiobiotin synthetase/7,8-diamino-pelargonic acid aminotransferase, mitochondrial isoform X2 [Nymphaea colorata]|uniref:bifunctional dethiobiotin synthetase/7,8-diamino-pelargonic acid aminotransferase, mitochondrial isoform X2 n=1 Tax=Nymphaea colorata TaxID=210225 RepID=UPI00129E76D6|nr:bifunctional dethiobiotin synthetase/7,8-diamino-pelargonic acid aminotransferase, mitochondrial isoform X2 [Nymphaea colorata]
MQPTSRLLSRARRHSFTCNRYTSIFPLVIPFEILISLVPRRSISTPSLGLEMALSHPVYTVWGSNTGVGKTLVSAGLATAVLCPASRPSCPSTFLYVKPVQTGFPDDSDSRFVFRKTCEFFLHQRPKTSLFASNQAVKSSVVAAKRLPDLSIDERTGNDSGLRELCSFEERRMCGADSPTDGFELVCKTLYGWKEAVSPHLAAEKEGGVVSDEELIDSLQKCLHLHYVDGDFGSEARMWSVIETAGGVASPGPSGSLQCDIYRAFRLPAILVGDGRLGGISGTISAYESLKLRGYDIPAVILEDHGLRNEESLLSYLRNRVHVFVLPTVPKDLSDNLMIWFSESQTVFSSLKEILLDQYLKRIHRFREMQKKAGTMLWWPFTQHKLVPDENITVIDSRCGENFAVYKAAKDGKRSVISQQFDACASWWTQGPDVALQIDLAQDMGYAAARYGHVMFPENVYEPALRCTELLIEGVGKGWASRTYFSDNGSTAIEIALKMAFRKYSVDHGILSRLTNVKPHMDTIDFKVLALNGSYHGDTLGAMEAQAPSPFTGFLQQPWYTGRGLFLDPPTVFLSNMVWKLQLPSVLQSHHLSRDILSFGCRNQLFSRNRDISALSQAYSDYISGQLSLCEGSKSSYIAALIIEPVIQGAGGMHMIDPLFQRILINECHERGIPVIYDEVFTGFWRLGVEFVVVCSRTVRPSTRYSLLCEADDWRGYTFGGHIGHRSCL